MEKMLFSTTQKGGRFSPIRIVALLSLSVFSLLAVSGTEPDPFSLYVGGVVAVVHLLSHWAIRRHQLGDEHLSAIVAMLVTLGMAMQYRLDPAVGLKQGLWFLLGTGAMLLTIALFRRFPTIASPFLPYAAMVFLFLLTLAVGTEINGARNWILIGGFSFQPSEWIKILFVFYVAAYFRKPETHRLRIGKWRLPPRFTHLGMVFVLLGFFVLQREFGTALLIFMVSLTTLYVFENALLLVATASVLATIGAAVALRFVSHLQVRLDSWLNPWADVSGKGYQITQSLFAIGSGGFFGTGIALGHPAFIPNVSTDFIFSAICEEMGIFGGIAVLLLFFMLAYRGIKVALQLKEPYFKALACGLTLTFAYQAFIIVGGVIKLIPLTGITLPFVSYGGSSLTASFVALGLLQALSGPILRKEAEGHEVHLHQ